MGSAETKESSPMSKKRRRRGEVGGGEGGKEVAGNQPEHTILRLDLARNVLKGVFARQVASFYDKTCCKIEDQTAMFWSATPAEIEDQQFYYRLTNQVGHAAKLDFMISHVWDPPADWDEYSNVPYFVAKAR